MDDDTVVVPPVAVVAEGDGTAVVSLGTQLAFPLDCLLTFLIDRLCFTEADLFERWAESARGALATIAARELSAPCEIGLPAWVELKDWGEGRNGWYGSGWGRARMAGSTARRASSFILIQFETTQSGGGGGAGGGRSGRRSTTV